MAKVDAFERALLVAVFILGAAPAVAAEDVRPPIPTPGEGRAELADRLAAFDLAVEFFAARGNYDPESWSYVLRVGDMAFHMSVHFRGNRVAEFHFIREMEGEVRYAPCEQAYWGILRLFTNAFGPPDAPLSLVPRDVTWTQRDGRQVDLVAIDVAAPQWRPPPLEFLNRTTTPCFIWGKY